MYTYTYVQVSGTDLFCANAGDSKALLVRLGATLPLSHEHKPSTASETARIHAAGGTVQVISGGVCVVVCACVCVCVCVCVC